MKKTSVKLVSIIITTRDRKQIVSECLDSVFKMDYPYFEVILIDNASLDGTFEHVRKNFPKVKIFKAEKNLGLNGGKNFGQKQAKGKYLLFLDSDTIVDKKLLPELIKIVETNPRIGIVCPKMYYYSHDLEKNNILWYAGAKVNFWTSQTKNLGCNEKDLGQYDQIRETDFAPTAYLVTQKAVKKLDRHEEIFFMTYGDTDFGYRTKKAGFKVIFCPQAILWHRLDQKENTKSIRALGYNLPLRAYYFARNRIIFMKKHAPKLNFLVFLIFFFPLMTIYITYKIIIFKGGRKYLKPHFEGSYDGLKYVFGGKIKNRWF